MGTALKGYNMAFNFYIIMSLYSMCWLPNVNKRFRVSIESDPVDTHRNFVYPCQIKDNTDVLN